MPKNEELETSKQEEMEVVEGEDEYEKQLKFVNAMATPMASKKLTKRLIKLVKKAAPNKTFVRHGLKEVQKYVRRGERGLVVFGGDVNPIDTYSHMPIVCENANIPYVFVPSKLELGHAMGSKKSACIVLVREKADYKDVYDKCIESVKALPSAF